MPIDGEWGEAGPPIQPVYEAAAFVRPASSSGNRVTLDGTAEATGSGSLEAEPDRHHPYVRGTLNAGFGRLASRSVYLYPAALREPMDAPNDGLYRRLNKRVRRAGLARPQRARPAFRDVFDMPDSLNERLTRGEPRLSEDCLTGAKIQFLVILCPDPNPTDREGLAE